jgi:ketosteroid isomerase-like protein
MLSLAAAVVGCTVTIVAQTTALDDMVRTEQRFAARALVVGWKQAFLEYFADSAVGFDADQIVPAKELFRKRPDPPKDLRLIWEPRYGDISSSGDLGYLTGPVRRINPAVDNGRPQHSLYASVWKRQADGSFRVVMAWACPHRRL